MVATTEDAPLSERDHSCGWQVMEGLVRGVVFGAMWGTLAGLWQIQRGGGGGLSWRARFEHAANRQAAAASLRSPAFAAGSAFHPPRPFAYPSHHYVSAVAGCAAGRALDFSLFLALYYGLSCSLERWHAAAVQQADAETEPQPATPMHAWLQNARWRAALAGAFTGVAVTLSRGGVLRARRWLLRRSGGALGEAVSAAPLMPRSAVPLAAASVATGALTGSVCYVIETLRE
ncbi:hypothetical protein CDCA_CDCA15G4090 [Cyanidium caldarium]|uniref:Uncharacterized protein n=1 Tax=Cyanidium caldarium TaxID=2771 RepID=A0AAV9J176_CYACA|nr:hypothetical protein CDCA_CDCA15G4090 [Cyanidium caldarium]